MKASELIAIFNKMFAEHWTYEWGAARKGCVDCSGAFVWAFKQFGQSIAHGSNTIARSNAKQLCDISQAKPGYAIFKRKLDDGEPDKYKGDGWGNFYHIGLLDTNGKDVLNAKGEQYGFCKDDISKWQYAMPLKGVEYDVIEDRPNSYVGKVSLTSGYLNVRATPAKNGKYVTRLYDGDVVNVSERKNGWAYVVLANGKEGWASEAYISFSSYPEMMTAPSEGVDIYFKITDSEGNVFIPKGDYTVEVIAKSND